MKRFLRISAVAFVAGVFLTASSPASAQNISTLLTTTRGSFNTLTDLISLFAYLAGIFWVMFGIYKLKDHVDAPQHVPISTSIKSFIAGGMFLSLPFMISVVIGNLYGAGGASIGADANDDLDVAAFGAAPDALDSMVVNVMNDITQPMSLLLNLFVYVMGGVFLLMGIHRLTQSMEKGPRGPAGMGTIMTFITAGAFFAMGDTASAFMTSFFGAGGDSVLSQATISTDLIPDANDNARVAEVVQAVMLFVMLVGMIGFIRGWIILRAFADGQQGATLAQGLTFLTGGALAMNLGTLVNAIQNTIGVSTITFN